MKLISNYWVHKVSDVLYILTINLEERWLLVTETSSIIDGPRSYEACMFNGQNEEDFDTLTIPDFLPKIQGKTWLRTSSVEKDQAYFVYNLLGIDDLRRKTIIDEG